MSKRATEDAIRKDIEAHRQRNVMLVQHITKRGADTARERDIDCFFHTRGEDAAITLSAFLQSRGFRDISIVDTEDGGDHPWTVQAVLTGTVVAFTAADRTEELVRIAADHDALFDGWGTLLDEVPPTI